MKYDLKLDTFIPLDFADGRAQAFFTMYKFDDNEEHRTHCLEARFCLDPNYSPFQIYTFYCPRRPTQEELQTLLNFQLFQFFTILNDFVQKNKETLTFMDQFEGKEVYQKIQNMVKW